MIDEVVFCVGQYLSDETRDDSGHRKLAHLVLLLIDRTHSGAHSLAIIHTHNLNEKCAHTDHLSSATD